MRDVGAADDKSLQQRVEGVGESLHHDVEAGDGDCPLVDTLALERTAGEGPGEEDENVGETDDGLHFSW